MSKYKAGNVIEFTQDKTFVITNPGRKEVSVKKGDKVVVNKDWYPHGYSIDKICNYQTVPHEDIDDFTFLVYEKEVDYDMDIMRKELKRIDEAIRFCRDKVNGIPRDDYDIDYHQMEEWLSDLRDLREGQMYERM